ncbi:MAG: ATP-dependent 6-phosphofructokinase [Chloroflexi bacterium]|jgi:6-phosphofructokinase 1|uniref:Phosphofructokinase n=1 Tax=Candidatus Thermofonsia Clade 3 bacterium TaxID=2364212 RepID=A0A2M8QCE9_9CHLR|nr:ATP-dependent 6-phosphofructokinase [Candidatus Roseilinea sp. NK_OTU-006]PJF47489.1 MAG: phosphofructokinase [Candidatus Thermofonsia Clade 3 bacterium]RMG62792.1 MAG: ATP-dependent 6-phosphofructokinase [Chloroflexota bacterium]
MRIGILTGGGDVPGLNSAIKAATIRLLDAGHEMIGIRRGWYGLLHFNMDDETSAQQFTMRLDRNAVRTVDRTGGTFLHTSRTNPANVKAKDVPEFLKHTTVFASGLADRYDFTQHVLSVLRFLGIEALITIGGDDTLSYSLRLHNEGFPIVAIPKTMDNDVRGTDYCIGFSTAVTRALDFIHNMRTCTGSHERIAVIELFGRYSGETALVSSYLGNVDRCLIAEVPFDIEKLCDYLLCDKRTNPSNYAMLVVSEGARPKDGAMIERGEADAYGHRKLGGIGDYISEQIKRLTGEHTMYQNVAYLMRSGAPDALDVMVSSNFGALAADLLLQGRYGRMVALQGGKYTSVPLTEVGGGPRPLDVAELYDAEHYRPRVRNVENKPMFLY